VVQLRKASVICALEGSVEEVDTGIQARFSSETELIGFLRERLSYMRVRQEEKQPRQEIKEEPK
jgi:hypothetical protein